MSPMSTTAIALLKARLEAIENDIPIHLEEAKASREKAKELTAERDDIVSAINDLESI